MQSNCFSCTSPSVVFFEFMVRGSIEATVAGQVKTRVTVSSHACTFSLATIVEVDANQSRCCELTSLATIQRKPCVPQRVSSCFRIHTGVDPISNRSHKRWSTSGQADHATRCCGDASVHARWNCRNGEGHPTGLVGGVGCKHSSREHLSPVPATWR